MSIPYSVHFVQFQYHRLFHERVSSRLVQRLADWLPGVAHWGAYKEAVAEQPSLEDLPCIS